MIIFVVLTTMMLGIIGYTIARPSYIIEFEGASHSAPGCHNSSGVASSGTLEVSSSTSGKLITLIASIQGFTDALPSNNRSGTFSIGIPYELGDNKEFGLGMDQNTVNGVTDYWGIGIWEIALDSNGNTVNPLRFRVLAPEADGTYDLVVAVINAANITGGSEPITYLATTISVMVTDGSLTILSLTMIYPINNIFLYVAFGLFGFGMIIFMVKHRKK